MPPGTGGDGLTSVAETLAGLTAAARDGGLDDTAALTAIAAARRLAAELERSELALIEAARDAGATWSRIAAAMGAGTGRPRRGATPISPAAARVHHLWIPRRRNLGHRFRRLAMTACQRQKCW